MQHETLTRGDVLRMLSMTYEQAVAADSASLWLIVQSNRRSLIHRRATAHERSPRLDTRGPLPERVRTELRHRWHVDAQAVTTATNAAAAAA